MLTFQYIQKGCLFSGTPPDHNSFASRLKSSLSKTLSVFPPLAGRLSTDSSSGQISIACSNAGALFIHAGAPSLRLSDVLDPSGASDVPAAVFRRLFPLNDTLSFDGHSNPVAAVQVTDLADGVFIGCSVNHAVVDGTAFWSFFNTLAEICSRGGETVSIRQQQPRFSRDGTVFSTDAVVRFSAGRPEPTFSGDGALRERIFHFGRRSVLSLKKEANESRSGEISSFQALCALVWRCVTRARKLPPTKTTSFVFPVNCRHRVSPEMDSFYFGNAIQIVRTEALAGDVASPELGWSADLLHRTVRAHDDRKVREGVAAWERDPRCFPLGNSDGATVIVGSSPRFPMYDNDFGWGRPVAVRTGPANKFDGNFSAFPGRDGDGCVDLEVVLVPETMGALLTDDEFMRYVN